MKRSGLVLVVALALASSACAPLLAHGQRAVHDAVCAGWSDPGARHAPDPGAHLPSATARDLVFHGLADECLRLNQVQSIGTHNSYHVRMEQPIFDALHALLPDIADSLDYSHPALATQFGDQGVRQIELDVFADPNGGLYYHRAVPAFLGLPSATGPAVLQQPGFKVLHVQDLDFRTVCSTFVECLHDVKTWSDAHPGHLPIAILVELKDEVIPDMDGIHFTTPIPIGTPQLDALDAEIRSVFPARDLVTPDDVRGHYPTLEDAVLHHAWPTLEQSKGKVLFLMDNASKRDAYLVGHPGDRGRVLFTNAQPGDPDAAFVEMNDPTGSNTAAIQDLVRKGYVVRTRADEPTIQARNDDTTMRDAALASGAQWVSTDYPVPGSSPFSPYFADIPNGHPSRCDPVNSGPDCRNTALEDLAHR